MSTTRREIVVSGRDAGLGSMMDRLKRDTTELGRSMMSDALQNSKNSRDAIRNYEEQIRVLERRNRLVAEGMRQEASSVRDRGISMGVSQSAANQQYQSTIAGINRDSKADQLQVQLLRELIDTVKQSSSQEIRAGRVSSESIGNIVARTTTEQGAEFGELQQRMLDESKPTGSGGGSDFNPTGVIGGVTGGLGSRTIGGAAGSVISGLGSMGGTLGKMGIAGMIIQAVSGLLTLPQEIQASRETASSTYAALTGRNVKALGDNSALGRELGLGVGFTNKGTWGPGDLNISRDDYMNTWLPGVRRARGSGVNDEMYTRRAMELYRGGAVDQGTIMAASRYSRVGGGDAMSMAGSIYNSMRSTGAFGADGQSFDRLSDLLSTLVGLQEQQLMSSGTVGSNANLNLLTRFSAMGGAYQREEYAAKTVSGLDQGLKSGGGPQANAMKLDALRRANPNMSFFELQAEMEKGISSKGYAETLMNDIKARGGTKEQQMHLAKGVFGDALSHNQILDMWNNNLDLSNLEKDTGQGSFPEKVANRAMSSSSQARTQLDMQEEGIGDVAAQIGQGITDTINELKAMGQTLTDIKNTASKWGSGLTSMWGFGGRTVNSWFSRDSQDN